MKPALVAVCAFIVVMFCGCAALQLEYESPTVNVTSFRALPSEGVVPRFEIGLHVINPNRTSLNLQGISYGVIIEGHKILTGVANDLPTIEAYGDGYITLNASPNLLSSVRLIADLMNQPGDTVSYLIDAKLDIGSYRPRIHVREEGNFSLAAPVR